MLLLAAPHGLQPCASVSPTSGFTDFRLRVDMQAHISRSYDLPSRDNAEADHSSSSCRANCCHSRQPAQHSRRCSSSRSAKGSAPRRSWCRRRPYPRLHTHIVQLPLEGSCPSVLLTQAIHPAFYPLQKAEADHSSTSCRANCCHSRQPAQHSRRCSSSRSAKGSAPRRSWCRRRPYPRLHTHIVQLPLEGSCPSVLLTQAIHPAFYPLQKAEADQPSSRRRAK